MSAPAKERTQFNPKAEYDIAIIGGGIHGTSMAVEASRRGLSVILVQGNDLASGASGIQRGLFNGGLQALSQFNLTAVRSTFKELSRWVETNPHTGCPTWAQVIPNEAVRSNTRVKAGLSLYHRFADKPSAPSTEPHSLPCLVYTLKPARHILNLASEAAALGADIYPYARITHSERRKQDWKLSINSCRLNATGQAEITAGMVINCCGWLANTLLTDVLGVSSRAQAQPRKAAQVYATSPFEAPPLPLILQLQNQQFLSVAETAPHHFILGPFTTEDLDIDASTEANLVRVREFLLSALDDQFAPWIKTLNIDAIKWLNYAQVSDPCGGVHRADFLQDSILDLNNPNGGAALLNVFGIDISKHALLARQGLDILAPFTKNVTTKVVPLENDAQNQSAPASCTPLLQRWYNTYQSGAERLMGDAHLHGEATPESDPELFGIHFGEDLFQAEVDYLVRYEWATTADDILWRRGDWGPWFPESGKKMLAEYLEAD